MLKLILFLILTITLNDLKAQNDLFNVINVPTESSDFSSVFLFLRQINQVKDKDLVEKDTIQFYKNDSLIYSYATANMARRIIYESMADSVLRDMTDSVFNVNLNAYDYYYTDTKGNKTLTNRRYYNKKGKFYLEEHYDQDSIVAKTKWDYNKDGRVIKEINDFIFDSSIYQMNYRWKSDHLAERHAKINKANYSAKFTTTYDTVSAVRSYNYRHKTGALTKLLSFTVARDDQGRATRISGSRDKKPFEINIDYERASTIINLQKDNVTFKFENL